MNQKPVSYLQTDPRWGYNDYSAPGEKTTIRASGCGPTAMAMVLATWEDKAVTPATECAWALAHGFKCPHSGTYYGYFVPAASRFGLTCQRLNTVSIYGNSKSPLHERARAALDAGDLVIACMGKGNWTSSGHYILLWGVDGDTVYVNDPASTRPARTRGSWALLKSQVKYYWVIKNPQGGKLAEALEDDDMDMDKLIDSMTDEQAYRLWAKARQHMAKLPQEAWSKQEGHWDRAVDEGIVTGGSPEAPVERSELIAILGRKGLV